MKKIGNYEVTAKVGEGGMATVFKGLQASLNRPVAIKVLSSKVAQNQGLVERFNRESLIIARLTHPNIVHVIDRGITEEGQPFFVMDYVGNTDLAKIMKNDRLVFNKKLDLIIQICKGLAYAHRNGVVHRDIKPANILIDDEDNAILTDFGIAQFYEQDEGVDPLTAVGTVLGTVSYMSPEQKLGSRDLGAETDIYSLGVIMYELFVGEKPLGHFKAPSDLLPDFPEQVDGLILKCLATDPEDRFHSADEVRDQLLGVLKGGHLEGKAKDSALEGIANLKSRFVLLDVVSENRYGDILLLQDKKDNQLMVVKKYRSIREGSLDKVKLITLRHDNIVKIFGLSEGRNHCNIVMEYLSGGSLKDRMLQPHSWREAISSAKNISEGLAFAHKKGLIHGNIRPSNVLFNEWGEEKISDFGLTGHYNDDAGMVNWYSPSGEGSSVKGDIYALGVVLYEMLSGERPTWKHGAIAAQDAFDAVPEKVKDVVLRMISRKKEDRYPSADLLSRALSELLVDKKPVPKPEMVAKKKWPLFPKKLVLVGSILVLIALGASFFLGMF